MNTNFVSTLDEQNVDQAATSLVRSRYDRIAPFYDWMPMQRFVTERFSRPWREKMWQMVAGENVIELGMGTGINIEFWPADAQITAIDLSPHMLQLARKRAEQLGRKASLQLGDIQRLDFPAASFDAAVATYVFCSVPDPILGLREMRRVVRPGGKVLLLEHMLSPYLVQAAIMNALNPLAVRMMGANINRRTLENIQAAGLQVERVEDIEKSRIFKFIVARP